MPTTLVFNIHFFIEWNTRVSSIFVRQIFKMVGVTYYIRYNDEY